MAELPTFEQLVAAQKGLGTGETLQAGIAGAEKGLSLAETIRQRKLKEMQEQEMLALRKANFMKQMEELGLTGRRVAAQEKNVSSLVSERGKPKVVTGYTTKEGQPTVMTKEGKITPAETTEPLVQSKTITTPMAEARMAGIKQQVLNNIVPAASKNKVLKDSAVMIFQDERLQALNDFAKGNPTPQEVEEMTVSFDRLLRGGGIPPVTEIQRLVPKSAMGSGNALLQWIKNEPTGTGQQELIKRLVNGAKRETEVAKSNIERELKKSQIAITPEIRKDPEFMKIVAETIRASVSPSELSTVAHTDDLKATTKTAGVGSAKDFLQKYNITPGK